MWCNTFVLHTAYVDSLVLSFPIAFKFGLLFHVLPSPSTPCPCSTHHPPPFYHFPVQRRMNTWMTIACGWQLRFAGTSTVREQFTGGGRGGREFGSQADDWHTKIPDRASLVNTSSGDLHSVSAFVIKAGERNEWFPYLYQHLVLWRTLKDLSHHLCTLSTFP